MYIYMYIYIHIYIYIYLYVYVSCISGKVAICPTCKMVISFDSKLFRDMEKVPG